MSADVGDTRIQAERFYDKEATLFINMECDRVGEQRFGGEQIHFEAFRHANAFDRAFGFG